MKYRKWNTSCVQNFLDVHENDANAGKFSFDIWPANPFYNDLTF